MRLLYSTSPQGAFCLTDDLNDDSHVTPRYAILSHTWGADADEVKFDDIQAGRAKHKIGYAKLEFCAEQARKDGIDYFWIDTCCINKTSDSELSQAIRSMFNWYRKAVKCYVFLSDVSSCKRDVDGDTDSVWQKGFRRSRWFTRGWTLQELLAPTIVEFFSRERVFLGRKDTLLQQIQEITGIPSAALYGGSIMKFTVEQRLTWAEKRQTLKAEDKAYCLFGILGVQLPVLYGEGQENALRRLKREVGVTLAQLDEVIQERYNNGKLDVERLSGKSLSLEHCFVNLGIIDRVHNTSSGTLLTNDESDRDMAPEGLSRFSLAARLKVETPPQSYQVSLNTLFEPRQQKDAAQLRPNRVLIWGRAGMGKTTLCKKIVHDFYKKSVWKELYDRVVWLPLRRLKRTESRNIVELLQDEFPFTGLGDRVSEALNKLIRDERTLFLLDGLDEVSFALDRDSPAGYILNDLMAQPHVIITSRPHSTYAYDPKLLDLTLEIIGFYPQQVETYLHRVAKETSISDKVIEEIRCFFKERPLIQSLAAIPLQLDAICYTWNIKHFPRGDATMTAIYQMISQSLWKNTVSRLGRTGDDGRPITRQQLEHWTWRSIEKSIQNEISFFRELGFWGLCENIVEFSMNDIEALETLEQISSDRFVHLPFLRVSDNSVGAEAQTFHFIHLTFQEFFAAQYFVSSWIENKPLPHWERTGGLSGRSVGCITPEDFIKSRKYIDHYDIFWRFVVGLLQNQSEKEHLHKFLDTIEFEPVDLVGLAHQRLVVHCLSELNTVGGDDDLRHRVRKLEDRYLECAFYESRLRRKWGKLHQSKSLLWEAECSEYVLGRLLDVQETEQETLGVLLHRSSLSINMLDTIVQKLSKSTTPSIRTVIIKIIGQHCSHDQRDKVLRLFSDTQFLRTTPFQIVCSWRNTGRLLEPASSSLVQLLQDPNYHIQFEAAQVLREQAALTGPTIESLVQLLQHPDMSVRSCAITALRGQTTLPNHAVEALVQLLHHSDRGVRSKAAKTLKRQTTLSNVVLERCVQLLQHSDQGVRFEAARVLVKQATLPSSAFNALVQMLRCPDALDYEATVELIIRREDMQSFIPTLCASTLQHFIRYSFRTSSVVCFIDEGCLCIRTSERCQKIPLQPHQSEVLRAEWQKARDELRLPSLMPVLSEGRDAHFEQ